MYSTYDNDHYSPDDITFSENNNEQYNIVEKSLVLNYRSYFKDNAFCLFKINYLLSDGSDKLFGSNNSDIEDFEDNINTNEHNYTHIYSLGLGLGRLYRAEDIYQAKRIEEVLLKSKTINSPFSNTDLQQLANIIKNRDNYKTTYPHEYDAYLLKDLTNFINARENLLTSANGYSLYKAIDSIQNDFLYAKYTHGTRVELNYQTKHTYNYTKRTHTQHSESTYVDPILGPTTMVYDLNMYGFYWNKADVDSVILQLTDKRIFGWQWFLSNTIRLQNDIVSNKDQQLYESHSDEYNHATSCRFNQKSISGEEVFTYQYSNQLDLLLAWNYGTYSMPIDLKRNLETDSSSYHSALYSFPIMYSNTSLGCRYYLTNSLLFNLNYAISNDKLVQIYEEETMFAKTKNTVWTWDIKNYF